MLRQPVSGVWSSCWPMQLAVLGRPGNRRTLRQTRPRQARPEESGPPCGLNQWAVPVPGEESQGQQHQTQNDAQQQEQPTAGSPHARNLGVRGKHRVLPSGDHWSWSHLLQRASS